VFLYDGLDTERAGMGRFITPDLTELDEMDSFLPDNLIVLILYLIGALIVGYLVGTRHARKQRREMQREFNQQNLEILEVKSKHAKLSKFMGQTERKNRLLKLTLKQLSDAKQRGDMLEGRLNQIEKQHYIKTSRLRLLATNATDKARRAANIASRATNRVKELEKAVPTQTINAPPPKSYGQAAAVPVRVVDQHSPAAQQNSVKRVSNRDSARFTRLRSSNEETRFNSVNLQAIDGIDGSVEKKLNQVGIHHVEQLANMSDSDLKMLGQVVGTDEGLDGQQNYTAAWKGVAQRLLGQS